MSILRIIFMGVGVLAISTSVALAQPAAAPANPTPPLTLISPSFSDGGVIPDKNSQAVPMPVSPALAWENTPNGTVSFTLIMHDLNTAPKKGSIDILHWLAFNIPSTTTSLPEGVPPIAQLPDGTIQPNNSGGKNGFMGPGFRGVIYHHYAIELYALYTKLNLGADASRADVLAAMDGHIIGKSALVARFHR